MTDSEKVYFVSSATVSERKGVIKTLFEGNTCSLSTDAGGTSKRTCRYEGSAKESECSLTFTRGSGSLNDTAMSVIRNIR